MRAKHKLSLLLAAASIAAGCDNKEDIVSDTPDVPAEGYHLTFDGGVGVETGTRAVWNDDKGLGNLIFQWDYTEDTETNEMVMAFINSGLLASNEGNYHTYATINKHEEHAEDKHWARFETNDKYEYNMPSGRYDGYKVLAVTPYRAENSSTVASSADAFSATLTMPCQFTQVAHQKPDFLRNYMYMYATSTIAGGSATLAFNHIPATFRFIVTNKRPGEAIIKSVKVSRDDGGNMGSTQLALTARATDTEISKAYTSPCSAITTNITGNGAALATDATYIAYAMALPLGDGGGVYDPAAFTGKQIKFTIEAGDPDNEYLSFVLDGSQLAGANPNGEYNWVGGKSYTIRMSLSDVLSFDGITVNDWTEEEEINGGEAEEQ